MGYRETPLADLPALFKAAADGDVPALARLAAAMESVDRDEDAARLWRLAAHLGDALAEGYVRDHIVDDRVTRPQGDDVLDAVLQLHREQQAGLADHRWLDKQMTALLKVPVCAIHRRLEPDRPGDYKVCGECLHVWRTRQEFVDDVARTRKQLDDYAAEHPELVADEPTGFVPVCGDLVGQPEPADALVDDPWTAPSDVRGLDDEDICPLCTHTF